MNFSVLTALFWMFNDCIHSTSIKQTRQNYLDAGWITLSAKRAFHHFARKLILNSGSLCTQLRCQIKMLHKYLLCILESLKVFVCALCRVLALVLLSRQAISGSFSVVKRFEHFEGNNRVFDHFVAISCSLWKDFGFHCWFCLVLESFLLKHQAFPKKTWFY